jgi:hypothetical protein
MQSSGLIGGALLDDAWSSHARAIAAFLSEAVVTRSGHEMPEFVLYERGLAVKAFPVRCRPEG